jgi:HEAT repeat protein
MNKSKLEDRLEQLRQLRSATPNEEVAAALSKALKDRSNLVTAEAAKTIAELRVSQLIPALLETFDHLFEDPVKRDSKCWGKTAIAQALTNLEYADSRPFIRGARHIQMEPVWGGQEDAAPQLRATCMLALVQCDDLSRPEVFRHLVDALADPADPVRMEAVRAIAQMNGDEACILLRLKARLGDRRPAVTGQVFDALLSLEGEKGIEFVTQQIVATNNEVRDEAALSLGSSRLPKAVEVLTSAWTKTNDQVFRSVLLRALSSSRQQTAIDFLLDIIRNGMTRDAAAAADALKLHENSTEILAMLQQAERESRSQR